MRQAAGSKSTCSSETHTLMMENTTKILREDPQREKKKHECGSGRGKKARNFGWGVQGGTPHHTTPGLGLNRWDLSRLGPKSVRLEKWASPGGGPNRPKLAKLKVVAKVGRGRGLGEKRRQGQSQRVRERHDLIMPNANDGSRLGVVVEGLPLFVGALHSDGTSCVGGKQGVWHSWKKTTSRAWRGDGHRSSRAWQLGRWLSRCRV